MLWMKEHKLRLNVQTNHFSCDSKFYEMWEWLQQIAHLFEAEGHGEHADSDDAVHHVHDQTPVRRRHLERLLQHFGARRVNVRQHVVSSVDSLKAGGDLKPSDSSNAGTDRAFPAPLHRSMTWRCEKSKQASIASCYKDNADIYSHVYLIGTKGSLPMININSFL